MSIDNTIEIIEIVWLAVVSIYLLNTLRRVKKLRNGHGPSESI